MTRNMNPAARRKSNVKGFSLIELVIVVVIIGIIAAIAIPRMSRGTAGVSLGFGLLRHAIILLQDTPRQKLLYTNTKS